ncbi:Anaphase-promoting complex, cyclosome, subunit 3 [Lishizhenia tianjinensis]|uniref:Anaphase-promoting complex, cyclosome, subunit 3 n=1 Tax=Lishizhenia tianjinensis TaxID=477690 RepID=A0A1I6ZNV2_9FLAO|nr:tetratricopeptide repeat protein [Lishizhenia tianjinensis]SFT64312.1 Anaphase-promoting complex, cyclosome, subunit 3 [Lishizhenia tianjinensis]
MIKLNYIGICLAFVLASFWGVAQPEDLKKQALDDAHSLSAKAYPNIEDFHKALRLQLAGNNNEAKEIYLSLVEKTPENDALFFALGNLALAENNPLIAQSYFQQAYDLDPKNMYYAEVLAMTLLELGEFERALPYWEMVVNNEPRDYNFQYYYAQCNVQLGKYKEAVKALNNVEGLVGVNPQISKLKIEMLPLIGQEDLLEEEITKLRLADPYNPETQTYILRHYIKTSSLETFKKRLFSELKQEYTDVSTYLYLLKIQPPIEDELKQEVLQKGIRSKTLPALSIAENLLFLQEQKVFSADSIKELADNIQNNFSDHPPVMDALDKYYKAVGKANNVLHLAQQRLEENPNDFQSWLSLSLLQSQLGLFGNLNASVHQAMENYPVLPQFYFLNAQVLAYYKEIDLAKESLEMGESYLLVASDTIEFLHHISQAHLAILEGDIKSYKSSMAEAKDLGVMQQDYQIAALHFQHFYRAPKLVDLQEVNSQLDILLYFQALKASADGNYTDAQNKLETFLSSYPEHANAWDLLGDVYFQLQQPAEAEAAWRKAQQFLTNNLNINKKLETKTFYEQKYY